MIGEVKAYGRIHAGLIDLSDTGYRLNGGIGWSISGLELIVRAYEADVSEVSDTRPQPVAQDEIAALVAMLENFARAKGRRGARIEVAGTLPAHRGFGGGTALRLAMLEASAILWKVSITPAELVAWSGRGGTSGIGVRTYFEGGLVIDLGHRRGTPPGTSRDRSGVGAGLPLARLEMPTWRFGIILPNNLRAAPVALERSLFQQALPVATGDVREMLYQAVFGMAAAALEDDPRTFGLAVNALQQGEWKRAEWNIHGEPLVALASEAKAAGALCVGLSSIGPSLYVLDGGALADWSPSAAGILWVNPRNAGRSARLVQDD